jgi:phosphoenolpyruvate synthase/pyruvate phosphate dikinase
LHKGCSPECRRSEEVLVAGITTPAWTPLFALASAVVVAVGRSLSHGSIVAREYGIPAVLVFQEIEFTVDGVSAEGWQAWH